MFTSLSHPPPLVALHSSTTLWQVAPLLASLRRSSFTLMAEMSQVELGEGEHPTLHLVSSPQFNSPLCIHTTDIRILKRMLPPELILNVFEHSIIGENNSQLIRLTGICKAWRTLLVSSPALWTTYTLGERSTMDEVRTWWERSRRNIKVIRVRFKNSKLLHDLWLHFEGWSSVRELDINVNMQMDAKALMKMARICSRPPVPRMYRLRCLVVPFHSLGMMMHAPNVESVIIRRAPDMPQPRCAVDDLVGCRRYLDSHIHNRSIETCRKLKHLEFVDFSAGSEVFIQAVVASAHNSLDPFWRDWKSPIDTFVVNDITVNVTQTELEEQRMKLINILTG